MKLAVAGKGGSGKTTVSGTLARTFGRAENDVLAIDDDDDPNLSLALGVRRDARPTPIPDSLIREAEAEDPSFPYEFTRPVEDIVADFGFAAPDGVTLLEVGEVEAGRGGFTYSHIIAQMLLADVETGRGEVTVLDLPNSLEHLGLSTARTADVLLVVVEPTTSSMETASRIHQLARDLPIPEIRAVANKVRTDRDLDLIVEYCERHGIELATAVRHDDAVRRAELAGSAPIDAAGDSDAVRTIQNLATALQRTRNESTTVETRGTD